MMVLKLLLLFCVYCAMWRCGGEKMECHLWRAAVLGNSQAACLFNNGAAGRLEY